MIAILSIWAHHEEVADPAVLEKVKHQLDAILGLGGGASAALFGAILLFIPVSILVFYYLYKRRITIPVEGDDWGSDGDERR